MLCQHKSLLTATVLAQIAAYCNPFKLPQIVPKILKIFWRGACPRTPLNGTALAHIWGHLWTHHYKNASYGHDILYVDILS